MADRNQNQNIAPDFLTDNGNHPDLLQLRRQAEEVARGKMTLLPENIDEMQLEDTRRLLHELQVHQIELEMQNEELRRMHAEMETSRSNFSDLYDFAPVGYLTFDKAGLIQEVNLTGAALLGIERNFLVNQPFSAYIEKDDLNAFREHCSDVLRLLTIQTVEIRLKPKGKTGFFALLESIVVKDHEGHALAIRTAVSDITDRKKAETALLTSEKHYRLLIENMLDGYAYCKMMYNRQGTPIDFVILGINSAFERLTGLKDVAGMKVTDVIPGIWVSHPELIETLGRVAATGRTEKFELEFKPLGIWLSISLYSTEQKHFTAVFDNITERKRAEESLQKSETNYRSLFENMINGFAYHQVVLNEQGIPVDYIFLEVNDAFERITGLKRSEIVGKRVREVLHGIENDQADWIGIYGKVALTGSEARFEQYSAQLDKWYSVTTYSPQKDYFVTIFDDITKRKRAETELLQNQEDLKHAQAVGNIGSWRLDVQRNVLIWSDENYRIFGIPKGTPLTYEIFLSTIHPDDRAYVDTQWKAGLRGEPYDIEHRLMVDGHVKWVREKAYLEFDHDSKLIGGFGITQDITEGKQAEQDLLKLSEDMAARGLELERLNQELETFNYSVSHDLRAPLRSIEGFSRALDAHVDRLDPEGRDFLERVITAAQKMGRLITDLLNLSRISQEKIRRDRVDLSGMAVRIAEELKQEHPERNVTFIICEGLSACGDERLLNIALENLIVNALKFTKNRSEAAIEFGITDGADGPAYFVKDNGVGFDMAYADKLFAPFQRLHADAEFPGTGIGLATVKRIINRHGGAVWIEGVKDTGATAYFTLP